MNKDITVEEITVQIADEKFLNYVETILDTIATAAKIRGTGIARRSPEYIEQKMREGKAIIALNGDEFAVLISGVQILINLCARDNFVGEFHVLQLGQNHSGDLLNPCCCH